MRTIPKFDLFSGRYGEQNVLWLETVEGLGNASDRMRQLAVQKPGPYFVFHALSRQVLDSVDTTPRKDKAGNKPGAKSDVA